MKSMRSMKRWLRSLVLLGLCGCAPKVVDPSQLRYPGELVAVAQLAGRGDFLARQTLVGRLGEREIHGQVVLQKRGSELTLIGLTPFGSKAFVIQQGPEGVRSQTIMAGALPFPPEFMLLDVHRALFMGLSGGTGADGERRGEREGEAIRETWADGRLLRRSFRRLDRRPKGTITIEYVGGMAGEQAPAKIIVDNGWFGYRVEISTISWQPI
ncbi:MAG: DUF3261 domain-containing protein [Nannocystis sp.]|uniref:DUF3261 domain-containing protein n=1 Tax=Nannocystis sp. TaxID=1962667 RepID=UPI0024249BC4|nr:DUF3261 domain-containing protein [Nannocystis sp.]MBK9753481.1 DUF3261 domain-containing protein [Nannocystis sp.]